MWDYYSKGKMVHSTAGEKKPEQRNEREEGNKRERRSVKLMKKIEEKYGITWIFSRNGVNGIKMTKPNEKYGRNESLRFEYTYP